MKIGVVADDITGANDIGSMFANGGYRVHVYAWDRFDASSPTLEALDVCIIDTNSRLDSPELAYRKVFAATEQLQAVGCPRFFNKTCSVFRGNVGAEFDAMLDALHEHFAVVVLGFPKNGRLTRDGIHYVHGQRLEESPFRQDPIHPMTQSRLEDILQSQTQRSVGSISHSVIAQGSRVLPEHVEAMRERSDYLIFDVAEQATLATIAEAVGDERVLCGSSALAEELPAVWGPSEAQGRDDALPLADGAGILTVAGSLTPQTAAQIEYMVMSGTPRVAVDTMCLFDQKKRQAEIERVVAQLLQPILAGEHALVHAANDPAVVSSTRELGQRYGKSMTEVARLVTETLAEIVAQTLHETGVRRLVVAGGETSAAVCRRMGIGGLRIWKEIQPGLPSCVSLTDPPLLLVLKSGSFGTPDFLEQAVNHLAAQ